MSVPDSDVPATVALLVSRYRAMASGPVEATGDYFELLPAAEQLAAAAPEEVTAALAVQAEQHRATVVGVVEDLLGQLPEARFEAALAALLRHDPALARSYAIGQYRWLDRLRDGPTADVTADILLTGHYSRDPAAREWSYFIVKGAWDLFPGRAWDIFAAIGAGPCARITEEQRKQQVWQHLWEWVLDMGPQDVYRMASTDGAGTATELAADHVDALLAAVARRTGTGHDLTPWLLDLGQDLPGCGVPSCCRPSPFEDELLRRGHNLRRLQPG